MILGLFPSLQPFGGIQTAGCQTALALARIAERRRWEFLFLSLNDDCGEHEISFCGGSARFVGFERKKERFVRAAISAALRFRPRLIFAAHPHLGPVSVAAKTVAPGSRIIIGTHGVEVWTRLPVVRRKALCRADIALTPSSYTAEKLAEVQGVEVRKIRRLPWALAPDFLHLANNSNGSVPPLVPHVKTVLSVARWESNARYKGGDLLIDAVHDLKAEGNCVHLIFAGSGSDLPRLKKVATDLGVSERVHFLQDLSCEALAAAYAAADIFALPSMGEGFGLVFLEAMAFGKPVIGAAAGGVPDIVENGETGFLIAPGNRSELAACIRNLLGDEELRSRMGKEAKRRATVDFSFQIFEARLAHLVEECLSS